MYVEKTERYHAEVSGSTCGFLCSCVPKYGMFAGIKQGHGSDCCSVALHCVFVLIPTLGVRKFIKKSFKISSLQEWKFWASFQLEIYVRHVKCLLAL